MNSLPIIDIAPLYSDDLLAWTSVADEIDNACREWGFFYIKGHPISGSRLDAVLNHAQRFFARPADEKLQIDITQTRHHRGYGAIATEQLDPNKPSDLKETFDMGFHLPADHPDVLAEKPLRGPNRHPSVPGWETLMEQHYVDMQALAQTLLRAMTLAMNIERDFFDKRFHEPVSVLRMIHYPPRHTASCEEQQGAGAHTDYGCITLLYQDAAGG
ncbi:2-oxoglutarate and iron-dependent oxygenase domain-containing protein, partial [Pseudomonas sp. Ant30-3]|uniref:2-oxoglutarate and iron-dependent oxygenase domain-containing protein n=1 Tax=Pseudomonas sp. Ant30-3 TaxID=1488328 RepID=UPI00048B706C